MRDGIRERIRRGASFSGGERNRAFYQTQAGEYKDLSVVSGLDLVGDGRAFALADLNRDGGVDVAVVSANAPMLQVFRNQASSTNGFIAVRLEGGNLTDQPSLEWSARDGVGARVTVSAGTSSWVREARMGEGLAAQNSKLLVVGLGSADRAEVEVRWPSGRIQESEPVASGHLVMFRERGGIEISPYTKQD